MRSIYLSPVELFPLHLKKVAMLTIPVLLVSCLVAILSAFVFHDHHHRKAFVGSVGLVASVAMYGSPLVVVKQVIQTKSVEFMPFYLSFFSFLASSLWMAYGLLSHDLFLAAEKGYENFKLERVALSMLVAGPALWLLGSIHNSCQIYERSDGHVQILQESVLIPFLMASMLFLIGAIVNGREQVGHSHRHGLKLLGDTWIWLGIFGSLILFIGALANVVKVFKMLQLSGLRLEKLRGGAQERLVRLREGQMPLLGGEQRRSNRTREGPMPPIVEEQRRERPAVDVEEGASKEVPTPYKDVLVGQR
ncbi:UNVERIFIED_CONTAM: Bidirectional sugar transporter SWEET3 [Sesamum latifolium]|uniref:Bidirectional sugar transporter SWEET n=1 Tax=Sesamum latifolium TaxID=2727402 RepID=A0AAW2T7E9_9LAMI